MDFGGYGMRWQGRRGSDNIEDRRTGGAARGAGIGGVGLLAVLAIGYFLGIDVRPLLDQAGAPPAGIETELTEADRRAGEFVSVTLADTEEVWAAIFGEELGRATTPPRWCSSRV
jgi:predicted metalloprotease